MTTFNSIPQEVLPNIVRYSENDNLLLVNRALNSAFQDFCREEIHQIQKDPLVLDLFELKPILLSESSDVRKVNRIFQKIDDLFHLYYPEKKGGIVDNNVTKEDLLNKTALNRLRFYSGIPGCKEYLDELKCVGIPRLERIKLFQDWLFERPELKNVKKLDLRDSKLHQLPSCIGEFNRVEELYLSMNRLMHLPNEMRQLTQLKRLDLRENPMKTFPKFMIECELSFMGFPSASGDLGLAMRRLLSVVKSEDREKVYSLYCQILSKKGGPFDCQKFAHVDVLNEAINRVLNGWTLDS